MRLRSAAVGSLCSPWWVFLRGFSWEKSVGLVDDDVMRQVVVGLLFVFTGCATLPPVPPSPVPLKVGVRPDCHGSSLGRVNPSSRLESALAEELGRQFSPTAFAAGDVLEIDLECERPDLMPPAHGSIISPGFSGTSIPVKTPFRGGFVWICLADRIGCEVDPVIVPEAALVDAQSVAQFIVLVLADKMKSDASLLAPGTIAK